jgi:TM2 domain-containing membrane protein YozV
MNKKSRTTTWVLAFFFGGFGVHKFYLGKVGQGLLYLFFFWTLIPGLVAFIEFIMIASMSDKEFDRKYNARR